MLLHGAGRPMLVRGCIITTRAAGDAACSTHLPGPSVVSSVIGGCRLSAPCNL